MGGINAVRHARVEAMDPKAYLDRYTNLRFFSPLNNERIDVAITGYGADWVSRKQHNPEGTVDGKACQTERQRLSEAVRVAHHGKASVPFNGRFTFSAKPLGLIPPNEEFLPESLVHAFVGKASPDEIIDTLRLALAVGRIGTAPDYNRAPPAAPTVAAYVKKFITLDCNGLVGNFYGMTGVGDIAVSSFASAARRRTTIGSVRPGDAIVTYNPTPAEPKDPKTPKKYYEHVALVQSWEFEPSAANAKVGKAKIRIVEWGVDGDESKHFTGAIPSTINVSYGKLTQYGIGFPNTDGTKFRYIFAPPATGKEANGWS